jgi:phage portal protein BeeE
MTSFKQVISQSSGRFLNTRPDASLKDADSWLVSALSMPNDSGIQVSEKTALALTAFYRGVTLLAGSIAAQPRHLFERYGENNDKRIDRDHPAARVFARKPNAYQNSYQYEFYKTIVMLLWGNYYAYIGRNAFYEPVSLHPIPPWTVTRD